MFLTLELQQLNELIESKVGYFSAPESFHAVNVEVFSREGIKAPTESGSEFPLPVEPLMSDFAIQPCELSNSAIPVVRTPLFSTHGFVQFTELFQSVFNVRYIADSFGDATTIQQIESNAKARTRNLGLPIPLQIPIEADIPAGVQVLDKSEGFDPYEFLNLKRQ